MIQRKQSIYLFFILTIVSFLLGQNPLMHSVSGKGTWTGEQMGTIEVSVLKIDGRIGEQLEFENRNMYLIYSLSAVGLLALLALFLFKNRKLQLLLCGFNYILMLASGVLMYIHISEGRGLITIPESFGSHYSYFVAILMPIWNFLAMRGILKDEKLIRSVDRLR